MKWKHYNCKYVDDVKEHYHSYFICHEMSLFVQSTARNNCTSIVDFFLKGFKIRKNFGKNLKNIHNE